MSPTASAQAVRTGFTTAGTQPRVDDNFSGPLGIGFSVNFFGSTYSSLYIGTNGYVTFANGDATFNPGNLVGYPEAIIAAFFADVDTSSAQSGQITWGSGTVNGRQAFAATWNGVGYYSAHADKLNTFQIVIINRSDRAANDFDFELNYNQIQWEAGDVNGGVGGLCASGCEPPSVGYSNGLTGTPNRSYEYPGAHITGAFLDTNRQTGLRYQQFGNSGVAGRLLFTVTSGVVTPLTITNLNPNTATAGSSAINPLTITGTGFAPNATVRWTLNGQTTNLTNPQVVSSTQITTQIPANLLTAAGTAQVVVANPTGSPSPAANFTISAPAALPTVSVTGGNGANVSATATNTFSVTLPAAALTPSTGILSLRFASDAVNQVSSDPEVTFVSGTTPVTTVGFSFATGQTTATLSPANAAVQAGTVAGTISTVISTYQGTAPPNPIIGTMVVPRSGPKITAIKLANKTASGFDVCVSGYSSRRDVTAASYQFAGSGTGTLNTTNLPAGADLIGKFTSWYQGTTSVTTGGQFLLDQTFTVSGPDNAIGSITVTLANDAGSTTSASVPYSGFAASCN